MIHITKQLDGERLAVLALQGFVDEAVLVVPMGGVLVECGFRVMEMPSHVAPTDPPRAATLDEIAEVAALLARKAEI
jgi:hypothetical protein